MAAAAILDFRIRKNFVGWQCLKGPDASLYKISSKSVRSIAEIFAIFQIFKIAAVRHLEFVWPYLDHPQQVIGGLISLQNLILIDAVFL